MNNWQKLIKSLYNYTFQTENELETYNNNKYPKVGKLYSGRALPSGKTLLVDVRNFYTPNDLTIPKIDDSHLNYDNIARATLIYVHKNITYVSDKEQVGLPEYWMFPFETLQTKQGDCIAEYEEIYTKDGIKSAKEIKEGDIVLSYDFNNKEFVYKPIIKKWNKGELNIKRVHFRNGQHIDVTSNHHMAVRTNQKYSNYIKQDLKDVDLSRWWKRKVPIAKKIPYNKSIPKFEKEIYRIIGHYIAEGWCDKWGVYSSGYDLIEDIIPILEKYEIPFTEFKNNSGVPCIRFLKGDLKEYLKGLKRNSFDITLYDELITLPEEYLEELIYGMWIGDGTKNIGKNQYNKEWCYSTSSEQLANDIQRMGLYLGRTFHIWKQIEHQGVGNQPIYRITYNPESHFLKDFGYKDISEVSISYIEDLGEYQTYDWEVQDTHTFVFKNGIITYQCEDGAILIANMLLKAGIPYWRIRILAGNVKLNNSTGGHAFCCYLSESTNEWIILDWCFYYDESIQWLKWKDAKRYTDVWFSFNTKYSYSEDQLDRENIVTEKKLQ